jgi:hypothetical protein
MIAVSRPRAGERFEEEEEGDAGDREEDAGGGQQRWLQPAAPMGQQGEGEGEGEAEDD